jgi:cyclophilin family peptidyl-prolyl cis-trans isomerase
MSPSSAKRSRKRQNAAAARAAQLEAARQAKRRQTMIRGGILGAFAILVAVVLAFVAGGGGKKENVSAGKSTTTTGADSSSTSTPETTATTAAGAGTGEITCNDTEPATHGNGKTYDKPPAMTIDPAKKYTATMDTSCGKIVMDFDAKGAPHTVNSFVFLAREKFYDGLTFHRVVKDFVIQGGDPKGNGSGGPGYTLAEEPPKDGYQVGSLAMAKTQAPNSTGSQFFIVTGAKGPDILGSSPTYSRFGKVTQGLEVAQKMETFLPPGQVDSAPSRPLYIFKVEITESAG